MTIINMVGGGKSVKVPLNDISTLSATAGDTEATLKWTDVGDLTVNGVLLNGRTATKLVRKVGSAPSDSSDGTLVTTSTTQDEYSVNGYTDTGLTNGTTYYYKVFSVGSNGLESGSNSVSVVPQQGGWTPGVNTVAYYPLETDTNDASGNSHDLSNGTQPLFATEGDLKYAYSTGSAKIYTSAFSFPLSEFTISFWVKITDLNQSGRYTFSVNSSGNTDIFCGLYGTGYNPKLNIYTWSITTGGDMAGVNPTVDTWYHFCYTFKSGTTSTVYVNGTSVGGGTAKTKSDTNMTLYLFCSSVAEYCKMGMSQFIIENKARTLTEIQNYFDQTKGDYGIS